MKGQIQKGATVANGAAGKENENNAVKKAEVGGNKQETKAAPKKEAKAKAGRVRSCVSPQPKR